MATDADALTLGDIRQLNQSDLDSATARLLLSRKRAELEDLMKRGRSNGRPADMVQRQCQGQTAPALLDHIGGGDQFNVVSMKCGR
jgi:hypothetical protein